MPITIKRPLSRIWSRTEGVALTEFAFALPLVLTLTLGGLETANYAFAHMRISQLAMTTADNAGRVKNVIDEANIYEVFEGADLVGEQIDFTENGRVVLSSLQDNGLPAGASGQMINWQRCFGDLNVAPAYGGQGQGRSNNSLRDGMGPTGNKITSLPNTAVMFVEVSYEYQPLIDSIWIGGDRTIRYESAFNVRERVNQNITNTQSLTVNGC
ncbi:MAG: pilus assembly protein [Sphingomonadaceae bacterium]|nr:pilus assembly protein [Sphingomonadaceae bacterium]